MPRFHVVAFDPNDNTTCQYISKQHSASEAVCNMPWLREIYNSRWVLKNIYAPDVETCISNCFQRMSWVVICVNLDEEIMKDLNGGDSSACSSTLQD